MDSRSNRQERWRNSGHAIVTPLCHTDMIEVGQKEGSYQEVTRQIASSLPLMQQPKGARGSPSCDSGGVPMIASNGDAELSTAMEFPSDEESKGTPATAYAMSAASPGTGRMTTTRYGNGSIASGEPDATPGNEMYSPPKQNYVTPDHGFFPSAPPSLSSNGNVAATRNYHGMENAKGSDGISPPGRNGTKPAPSRTPPRAPTAPSFLQPRGNGKRHQGRILFGPNGIGAVKLNAGVAGPQIPMQQLRQDQHHPQQYPSPFSERGRKRRAYSVNGPLSSSLQTPASPSNCTSVSEVSATDMLPCPTMLGAAGGLFSQGANLPHLSPGSIGLESMSIRSPKCPGYNKSETTGNAPQTVPTPSALFHKESGGDASISSVPQSGSVDASSAATSKQDCSIRSSSASDTPTYMLQTPQSSPSGRQGTMPCPQFSSSSAFGSIGGGDGSVGGGSSFCLFRSRTPSPSPGALLQMHRQQESADVGMMSVTSTSTNHSSCLNDTSLNNSRHSISQIPLPSPRHVPLMVLTKKTESEALPEDGSKEPEPSRAVDHRQGEGEHITTEEAPPERSPQRHPPASASSPRVLSSESPSSAIAGSPRRFGLSPRKPLPSSMLSPGVNHGPVTQGLWPTSLTTNDSSSPSVPFLSPRSTKKDKCVANLLFGEDDGEDDPMPKPTKKTHPYFKSQGGSIDGNHPKPIFPSTSSNDGDEMGGFMDGLLKGFANRGRAQFESSNSLAFSKGSSSNSLDKVKGDEHSFPIKTLTFGGEEDDERKMRTTSQHCNRTPGVKGSEFPTGFQARSVLTPSKSGGSLERLLDADRRRRAEKGDGVDFDDGSLSDSCDDSRGPNDTFFLNSPEAVTAESIQAAEIESSAGMSPDEVDFMDGRERKRRSIATADSQSSMPSMPMEISESYKKLKSTSRVGQVEDADKAKERSTLQIRPSSMTSSSSDSKAGKLDKSQQTRSSISESSRRSSSRRSSRLKKARSVTFSPSPEISEGMSYNMAKASSGQRDPRTLTQSSSSSLYGMDIVQEELPSEGNHNEVNTSAVTPASNSDPQNTSGTYQFSAISSRSRMESGDTLSIRNGSHYSLQQFNTRQSFGSSGSLLAHFNNLNKQDSDVSFSADNFPGELGPTLQRASSRESTLGLPIGNDDEDTAGRPPSRARMYTPPSRDLITPPAQTFSLCASGPISAGRGGRLLSPPPIPKRSYSTCEDEPNDTRGSDEDAGVLPDGIPLVSGSIGHNDAKRISRKTFLFVAPADKDAVQLAIARMAAEAEGEMNVSS